MNTDFSTALFISRSSLYPLPFVTSKSSESNDKNSIEGFSFTDDFIEDKSQPELSTNTILYVSPPPINIFSYIIKLSRYIFSRSSSVKQAPTIPLVLTDAVINSGNLFIYIFGFNIFIH